MALSVGDVDQDITTSTLDWIAATRRLLEGTQRSTLNLLTSDIGHDATTIPLTYDMAGVSAGALLTVDLEVMYVWAVDPSGHTATVQRGAHGSTPAPHSAGDLVTVNPRFTDWEIFAALNSDLRSLSSPVNGLYQIKTLDITAISGREGYDFPVVGFQSVADIRWQLPGTVTNEWPEITDYEVNQNLPTTTFPSGTAVFFNAGLPAAQQTVRVRYRANLGILSTLNDDVGTVTGIPATAFDIPPLGAALAVMAGRPVRRADFTAQGDTRRQDEVHVGDVTASTAMLRAQRQQRINEEASRLNQTWPIRRNRVSL